MEEKGSYLGSPQRYPAAFPRSSVSSSPLSSLHPPPRTLFVVWNTDCWRDAASRQLYLERSHDSSAVCFTFLTCLFSSRSELSLAQATQRHLLEHGCDSTRSSMHSHALPQTPAHIQYIHAHTHTLTNADTRTHTRKAQLHTDTCALIHARSLTNAHTDLVAHTHTHILPFIP